MSVINSSKPLSTAIIGNLLDDSRNLQSWRVPNDPSPRASTESESAKSLLQTEDHNTDATNPRLMPHSQQQTNIAVTTPSKKKPPASQLLPLSTLAMAVSNSSIGTNTIDIRPTNTADSDRRQLWSLLWVQFNQNVDTIYARCEQESFIPQCQEVLETLNRAVVDFKKLIEQLQLQEPAVAAQAEANQKQHSGAGAHLAMVMQTTDGLGANVPTNTATPSLRAPDQGIVTRVPSVAWEVRKSSPLVVLDTLTLHLPVPSISTAGVASVPSTKSVLKSSLTAIIAHPTPVSAVAPSQAKLSTLPLDSRMPLRSPESLLPVVVSRNPQSAAGFTTNAVSAHNVEMDAFLEMPSWIESTLVQSPEFTTVSGRRMRGGARGGGVVSFSPSAVNADFGVDPRALSLAMSDEVRSNSAKRLQQAEFNRSQIRTNKQINSRNWNDKLQTVIAKQQEFIYNKKQVIDSSLEKAEELHDLHVRQIQQKAANENVKVSEVAFINQLGTECRKLELARKLAQTTQRREATLAQRTEDQRLKQSQKEEAALERRTQIEVQLEKRALQQSRKMDEYEQRRQKLLKSPSAASSRSASASSTFVASSIIAPEIVQVCPVLNVPDQDAALGMGGSKKKGHNSAAALKRATKRSLQFSSNVHDGLGSKKVAIQAVNVLTSKVQRDFSALSADQVASQLTFATAKLLRLLEPVSGCGEIDSTVNLRQCIEQMTHLRGLLELPSSKLTVPYDGLPLVASLTEILTVASRADPLSRQLEFLALCVLRLCCLGQASVRRFMLTGGRLIPLLKRLEVELGDDAQRLLLGNGLICATSLFTGSDIGSAREAGSTDTSVLLSIVATVLMEPTPLSLAENAKYIVFCFLHTSHVLAGVRRLFQEASVAVASPLAPSATAALLHLILSILHFLEAITASADNDLSLKSVVEPLTAAGPDATSHLPLISTSHDDRAGSLGATLPQIPIATLVTLMTALSLEKEQKLGLTPRKKANVADSHIAPPLPIAAVTRAGQSEIADPVVRIVMSALCILNNVARLDLSLLQNFDVEGRLRGELYHLLSFWLRYSSADSSAGSERGDLSKSSTMSDHDYRAVRVLLHQLLLFVGYFTLENAQNQETFRWGRSPTLLHRLCNLPFRFFSDEWSKDILFPSLISIVFLSDANKEIMTEELNQSFVADYIREQLARLHLSRELVESLPAAVDIPLKSEALVTNVAKTDVDAPLAESDAAVVHGDESMASLFQFKQRFPVRLWNLALAFFSK